MSDATTAGAAVLKKVKLEKSDIAEDLEDAEETQKYLQLSEDNKMSEIDDLKGKNKRLEEENEALRRGG